MKIRKLNVDDLLEIDTQTHRHTVMLRVHSKLSIILIYNIHNSIVSCEKIIKLDCVFFSPLLYFEA